MTKESIFNPLQKKILRIVQDTLPDSQNPYYEIAKKLGTQEEYVLNFLKQLKSEGYIRRFGATLRHQEAGYGCNVMVAWFVDGDKDIDKIGQIMRDCPEISHCYQRKNCYEWPYNLYTMVHGKTRQECLEVVEKLSQQTDIAMYELLFSDEELKKTSMQYF